MTDKIQELEEQVSLLTWQLGEAQITVNTTDQLNNMLRAHLEMIEQDILKPLVTVYSRSAYVTRAREILNGRPSMVTLDNHDANLIDAVCKRLKFATLAYTSDDAKNAVKTVVEVMDNEAKYLRMDG